VYGTTPVGKGSYETQQEAILDAVNIALELDAPTKVIEVREVDRIYACGCSNEVSCQTHENL